MFAGKVVERRHVQGIGHDLPGGDVILSQLPRIYSNKQIIIRRINSRLYRVD